MAAYLIGCGLIGSAFAASGLGGSFSIRVMVSNS
jgi:hypothetical protein